MREIIKNYALSNDFRGFDFFSINEIKSLIKTEKDIEALSNDYISYLLEKLFPEALCIYESSDSDDYWAEFISKFRSYRKEIAEDISMFLSLKRFSYIDAKVSYRNSIDTLTIDEIKGRLVLAKRSKSKRFISAFYSYGEVNYKCKEKATYSLSDKDLRRIECQYDKIGQLKTEEWQATYLAEYPLIYSIIKDKDCYNLIEESAYGCLYNRNAFALDNLEYGELLDIKRFILNNIPEFHNEDKIHIDIWNVILENYGYIKIAGVNILYAIRDIIMKNPGEGADFTFDVFHRYLGVAVKNENDAMILMYVKKVFSKHQYKRIIKSMIDKGHHLITYDKFIEWSKIIDISTIPDDKLENIFRNPLILHWQAPALHYKEFVMLRSCHDKKNHCDFVEFIEDYQRNYNFWKDEKLDVRLNKINDYNKIYKFVKKYDFNDEIKSKLFDLLKRNSLNSLKIKSNYDEIEEFLLFEVAKAYNIIIKSKNEIQLFAIACSFSSIEYLMNTDLSNLNAVIFDEKNNIGKYLVSSDYFNLSPEFINKYIDNIKNFIYDGDFYRSMKYFQSISSESKVLMNFRNIVKAKIMNQYDKIRWNKERLMMEIDDEVNDCVYENWKKDTIIERRGIKVTDASDFKSVLTLGHTPVQTCMDYDNGSYNDCLISNFDECKKVLKIYKDGIQIGRAILRLTKTRERKNLLTFDDVSSEKNKNVEWSKPNLTIFVEKMYTPCVEKINDAKDEILNFLHEKAKSIGAVLNFAFTYGDWNLKITNIEVMISASRNGHQYIDSLHGCTGKDSRYTWVRTSAYIG